MAPDFVLAIRHATLGASRRPHARGNQRCQSARATGIRQPVPKARSVMRRPGAAWRRLNSAVRTSRRTRVTVAASKPAATISDCDW